MLRETLRSIKRLLRASARNVGYEISSSQKYGVDMTHDVTRLCAAWSRQIRVAVDVGANAGLAAKQFHRAFTRSRD